MNDMMMKATRAARKIQESLLDAIDKSKFSAKQIADFLGLAVPSLYRKTNPNDTERELSLRQFVLLVCMTDQVSLISPILEALGKIAVDINNVPCDIDDIKSEALSMASELTGPIRVLSECVKKGAITPDEYNELCKEIYEAEAVMERIRLSIRKVLSGNPTNTGCSN